MYYLVKQSSLEVELEALSPEDKGDVQAQGFLARREKDDVSV